MKFIIQKNTRTTSQFFQDMNDFRLKEITRIIPSENFIIIETK